MGVVNTRAAGGDVSRFEELAALGGLPGWIRLSKFGFGTVDNTMQPLRGQPSPASYTFLSSAASVEVVSTSANDAVAGTGTRYVIVEGAGPDGRRQVSAPVAMAGLSAAAVPGTWLRIDRVRAASQGQYGQVGSCNAGAISVQTAGGGAVHALIPANDGSTFIAGNTIPVGFQGLFYGGLAVVESGKTVDISLYVREQLVRTSAPHAPMRVLRKYLGRTSQIPLDLSIPTVVPEGSDFVCAASVSTGTAIVTISYEMLLKPI